MVVAFGDCTEAFLARCVPYLEFENVSIVFGCADLEVDTNCCNEVIAESVFCVAEKDA